MFQDISFDLEGGTALVVTGANGIGKSSLLRALAGLVPLASGEIRLSGGEAEKQAYELAHYFGHQDAVKPALSVMENLTFWQSFTAAVVSGHFAGSPIRPLEALRLLGIAHTAHLPAAYLSAGQKRRLSLARLLVIARPLWLMDEPTSALDKASEHQLLDLMNKHLSAGGLIVTATHTDLALNRMQSLHMRESSPLSTADDWDLI